MKRWLLCALVAPLAACSQGGGSGGASTPNFNAAVCSPAKPAMAGMTTQSLDGQSPTGQDPFETRGKVVLSSMSTGFSGMTTQATEAKLPAGTGFTVTLRDACENPGELARAVLMNEQADEDAIPGGVRSYDWTLPQPTSLSRLMQAAEEDACVVGVSEAGVAEINTLPSDPLVATQAHLSMLEAGSALDRLVPSVNLKPVVIAIIDTGVDIAHEDMKNVLWTNSDEIAGNGVDDDKNGYKDDVHGYNFEDRKASPAPGAKWGGYHHGTHVAGLAGAQGGNGVGGTGVMGSNVRIMGLNVFGSTSGARVSDVANAIRYAADNGADIVNLSLGGSGKNATYESALSYAIKKGVTILTAAGNDGRLISSTAWMSPGAYGATFAGMINIGSLDSETSSLSYFSNYSSKYVELGAPGAEKSSGGRGLLSTYPGNKYIRAMGTSMATPVAAGSAALAISLLRQRGYSPSPATIEAVLGVSARTLDKLKTKIRDGRALNLRHLADFIERTYPAQAGAGDPGVPGYDACALSTSQNLPEDSGEVM